MKRPNYFTTTRLERIKQGHRKASNELMGEALVALEADQELSDEQRKYLIWGLKRELAEKSDAFNLRSGTLQGNIFGALSEAESDWEAYLATAMFIKKGQKVSEACESAVKYLLKHHGVSLAPATIDKKYKKVKREYRCAELVFSEVVKLDSDSGEDLDLAVQKACQAVESGLPRVC